MASKQFLVGITPGAPTVGTSVLSADFLTTCIVNYLFINNNHMDSLGDEPQYTQNVAGGQIDWWDYEFQYKDRLIIDFTPFCPVLSPCQES